MKARVTDVCIALAGLTGAGALGLSAYRTTQKELPAAIRRGVGHALGVADSAVSLSRASIDLSGLHVDGLAVGSLAVQHATYTPTLASLFSGHARGTLRVEGVVIEDPPVGAFDRVAFDRAELQIGGAELRGHAHGITATPMSDAARATAPVSIEALGIQLARRDGALELTRAALTGLRVGVISGLAGAVHRIGDTFEVRAAGEGAQLVAHLSPAGADLRLQLTGRELAWNAENAAMLDAWGLPSGHVKVSGTLSANAPRPTIGRTGHFTAALAFETAEVTIPRFATAPLTLDGTEVEVHGEVEGHTFATEVQLHRGDARLDATLRLDGGEDAEEDDRGDVLSFEVRLPRTGCAEVLAAVPMSLRPALDGMGLQGQLAGAYKITLPLAAPLQMTLAGDLDNQCHVAAEAPLADVRKLRGEGPVPLPAVAAAGAATPTFRPLDRIPSVVVQTILDSEDGRFYQHHGVDVLQIRRAMAHDLEVGAPGRGGSTVTQQVAKNLFLSGERTFGRKLEEAVLAWRLEQVLNKHRILELYVNLVEMAPGVYGVADGAKHWLKKDVGVLTLDEALRLAALLPAPKRGMDDAWHKRYLQLRGRVANLHASRRAPQNADADATSVLPGVNAEPSTAQP